MSDEIIKDENKIEDEHISDDIDVQAEDSDEVETIDNDETSEEADDADGSEDKLEDSSEESNGDKSDSEGFIFRNAETKENDEIQNDVVSALKKPEIHSVPNNSLKQKKVRKVRKVKEKKSHKGLIIGILSAVVAIVLLIVLLANWSKIFHKHVWVEATCEKAKECSTCGKTEGEPLGHSFEAATCEKPSTCSNCGLTQGDALGHIYEETNCGEKSLCTRCGEYSEEVAPHSVDIGICSKCGEFQNEELLFQTMLCWNEVVNTINGVGIEGTEEDLEDNNEEEGKPAELLSEEDMALSENEAVSKAAEAAEKKHRDDVYNDICTRIYNYQHALEPLGELIKMCGDYESLQDIKNKADELLVAIPLSYISKEDEAMLEFMQNEEQMLQIQKDINDGLMAMISDYFSYN